MTELLLLDVLRKENIDVIEEREKTTASIYVILQKNIVIENRLPSINDAGSRRLGVLLISVRNCLRNLCQTDLYKKNRESKKAKTTFGNFFEDLP